MGYGEKRNRSQNSATTNSNTNSFREVSNNQDFTQGGIGWLSGKDIPKYWSSIQPAVSGGADDGRGYSIDSGYCEWSPGNRIDVGGTNSQGNQPAGINDGASSRYCYQWQRVGGVVTGSGRVQLGVNGGTDGTSATWLQYGQTNDTQRNGALYTSYDTGEQDKLSGNFSVATIPLPVYYQTNISVTTGINVNPPVESRADLIASPLNSVNAKGLRGVKYNVINGQQYSTNRWIGGAGTVVGGYWNTVGDEDYEYQLFYPDGTSAGGAKPPILNVSGVIHFDDTERGFEAFTSNAQAKYMNIIVRAPQTPRGPQLPSAFPAANLMNFGGSRAGVSYSFDEERYILPPMFHFTFSYTLGGYPSATNNIPIQ